VWCSAQGTDFAIFVGGLEEGVDGTRCSLNAHSRPLRAVLEHGCFSCVSFVRVSLSCSTPTFAGIVALLNDVRLSAGKSTLGW
jgi:hypothetical protein